MQLSVDIFHLRCLQSFNLSFDGSSDKTGVITFSKDYSDRK